MTRAVPYAILALLAACGGLPRDYAVICINEVGAPGEYDYFPTSDEIPVVFPAQDGNVPGAERINACIRERAARDGVI